MALHAFWNPVAAVAFSLDSRCLASLCGDVKVWTADNPGAEARARRAQTAQARTFAWHQQEASRYYNEHRWSSAIRHLSQIIALDPSNGWPYARRGDCYGFLSQWKEAEADFARAFEFKTADSEVGLYRAALYLRQSDHEGYHTLAVTMLDRFGQAKETTHLNNAAWVGVLAPDARVDIERCLRLAEAAVKQEPNDSMFVNTLAACLYRSGKWAEAVERLNESARRKGHGGLPEGSSLAR
jgi:tetratricopeptide (TPR) repeat protein